MHGVCFDFPLQEWFDFEIPETGISPDYIESCLNEMESLIPKPSARVLWLGGEPSVNLKGHKAILSFQSRQESFEISTEKLKGEWLIEKLNTLTVDQKPLTFALLKTDFEKFFEDFELFWSSKPIQVLRDNGLLVLG